MSNETAKVSQDMLEKFVSGKYHWKALTPNKQMAMARELLQLRAFFVSMEKYQPVNFGVQHEDSAGQSTTKP